MDYENRRSICDCQWEIIHVGRPGTNNIAYGVSVRSHKWVPRDATRVDVAGVDVLCSSRKLQSRRTGITEGKVSHVSIHSRVGIFYAVLSRALLPATFSSK